MTIAVVVVALAAAAVLAPTGAGASRLVEPGTPALQDIWVSPSGNDTAAGTAGQPVHTLQAALDRVGPGSVVHLLPGAYRGDARTKVDGTATARITIVGPQWNSDPVAQLPAASQTATIYGDGGHVLAIENSYYTLGGFSIDGEHAIEAITPVSSWPTSSARAEQRWKSAVAPDAVDNRLVYIDSGRAHVGVRGTTLRRMVLTGAGGECVRVRNDSSDTVIKQSVIRWCGMFPKRNGADRFTFHNGEGVYVGTSPRSTDLSGHLDDVTTRTEVIDSRITTFGSECLDVKENARDNMLSRSTCADNLEPLGYEGSDIELRGSHNTVSRVLVGSSAGYGVKIASDRSSAPASHNIVRRSTFTDLTGSAIDIGPHARQGRFCDDIGHDDSSRMPRNYARRC